MSTSQLLIEKPTTANEMKIRVVLEQNGYRRAKLDETEDYEGRIITLSVPDYDYKYIKKYGGEIGSEYDHVQQIFRDALVGAGLPSGYRVVAVFKDSLNGDDE